MIERVRQAELARRLDVSRQAINELVQRGILVVGEDGLIDEAAARIAIDSNVHPTGKTATKVATDAPPVAETPPPEVAAMNYHTAKTLREFTEAQRAALKLRQEIGELAPLAEVDRCLRMAILHAREYLRAEPPRLAVLLDGLDRIERETLLAETFDEFLRRLAEWQPSEIASASTN